jgi:peptidoglycan/xylan/chitin deacetylase (PgdA/CDA1 family)
MHPQRGGGEEPEPMEWQVPVVVFHHVSWGIDYYTNTPPDIYANQISFLAEEFRFWSVRQAYEAYRRKENPAGHIIITFDDGYEDNFTFARPVLAAHGIKATFFVLPDYIGGENTWNGRCNYRARHMNWKQLQSLVDEGHEIGSHGVSHRALTEMGVEEAEYELVTSRAVLADRLGVKVKSFAYPYGLTNSAVSELASRHYEVAFSTVKSTVTDWAAGLHALRRTYLPVNSTRSELLHVVGRKLTYDLRHHSN